jgi:positive regulator of sigma E activity
MELIYVIVGALIALAGLLAYVFTQNALFAVGFAIFMAVGYYISGRYMNKE